jgi:hypothetical protein
LATGSLSSSTLKHRAVDGSNEFGPTRRISAVSTEVALIPQCVECGEVWLPADEDRWQAHLDTEDELVFYCRECAQREFSDRD